MDRVAFTDDDGQVIDYYVLAEAKVGQNSYLLCTENDDEDEDAEAVVLKAVPGAENEGTDDEMVIYESIVDDEELRKAVEALEQVLGDVKIEL